MFQYLVCTFFVLPLHSWAAPDPNCGISEHPPPPSGHRVVNGTLVKKGELPWLAELRFEVGGGVGHCTGSIISPNHVLTAGHCYVEGITYTVKMNTIDSHDETSVSRESTKAYLHPKYGRGSLVENDIAIIEFDEPLEFDDNIRPICLKKTFDETKNRKTALTSGYGAKKFYPCPTEPCYPPPGTQDGKLRRGTSLFVSPEKCKQEWKEEAEKYNQTANINPNVHLCTVGQNEVDVYAGDSGGPIQIQNAARSDGKVQWMQVGICSFGDGQAYQKLPSVFTRLTTYCDWIAETTKNAVECSD